jgi:PhnB protein
MKTRQEPRRRGYHTITPSLCVRDARAAVKFYVAAFDAKVIEQHDEPDGKISNVTLRIGDSPLMVSDETSQHALDHAHEGWPRSPHWAGEPSASMYIYVPDADAVVARAVEAGATVIAPVQDREWGDRLGGFRDPFGHIWNVATHVAELAH